MYTRKKFGDTWFMLLREVSTKKDANEIKGNLKLGDPRIKVRIVKQKRNFKNVYCVYAHGEF